MLKPIDMTMLFNFTLIFYDLTLKKFSISGPMKKWNIVNYCKQNFAADTAVFEISPHLLKCIVIDMS